MRALVIDDSRAMRRIVSAALEGFGYETRQAGHGREALDVLQEGYSPDLCTIDWNMPVMDGYEFLGNLRRMPGGDAPKVVFCTTENDAAHIRAAIDAGADEYVMKPFDRETLESKLQIVGVA